jgi:hypothetical protein
VTSDVFRDRWVGYRSASTIKRAVQDLLANSGLKGAVTFNIVELIKKHLTRLPGGLKIDLYDQDPGQPEAYVSYKPLTLHIDREIWKDVNLGEPRARYILVHEIGHIILHRVDADLGFSEGPDAQLRAPPEERSAEWQANVFAHFLLVPDEALVVKMPLMHKAADINVASYVIATVQVFDGARDVFTFVAAPRYTGDTCGDCGNLTVSRLGLSLACDTCGWKADG